MESQPLHKKILSEISIKQLWLGGVFAVASVVVWIFIFRVFSTGSAPGDKTPLLLAAILGWIILFNLTLLFLERKIAYALYGALLLLLAFLFGTHGSILFGIFGLGLAMLWAQQKAQNERSLLVEFKAFRISRRALPIFFTGVALFLAFSYQSLILDDALEGDLSIPPAVYDSIFEPTERILNIVFSDYERGMSIGDFQQLVLRTFLPSELFRGAGQNAPFTPSFVGDEIASQSLRDFSFNLINANITAILEPYRDLLPFLFIIGLFFVFKTFSLPFLWLTFIFSWLVIKLLLLYNFVTVKQTSVEKIEAIIE